MSPQHFRPTTGGILAVVLAHAAALTIVCHYHYFAPPPTRQLWVWLELGLSVFFWLPARLYVFRVLASGYRAVEATEHRTFVAIPCVLGFVVARWWAGTFADTLWLHPVVVHEILDVVLAAAHAALLAAAYGGLVTALVLSDKFLGGGSQAVPSMPPDPIAAVPNDRPAGSLRGWLIFALLLGAANAFVVWYIGQEHVAYYWDYMVYWTRASDFAEVIRVAPETAWDRFRLSVRNDDYGLTPAVLPALFEAVFGDSRLAYILAIVNLYLAAVAVAGWWFVRRFAPTAPAALVVAVPAVVTFTSPIAWAPLLHGYLDIGGVAIATVALTLYLSHPVGRLRWHHILTLAALLALLALFRRWYTFFIVAFVLLAGLESVAAFARTYSRDGWRKAIRGLWAVGSIGFGFLLLIISFAEPWVERVLKTNYAADYTAYHTEEPFAVRAGHVLNNCGPGFLAAALAGLVVLVCFQTTRRPALFVAALYPIILTHFLRTQEFGPHHHYLLLPAYLLLPSLALTRVLTPAAPAVRWLSVSVVGGLGGLAAAVMFVPALVPWREPLRPVISGLDNTPIVRNDLPEFLRMVRYLGAATAADGGKVTLIGSSLTINVSMLYTADQSFREPLLPRERVLFCSEVDRVGGFPAALFQAEVVAVAAPLQTHLRESEQQAVVIATDSLLNHKDVGNAFEKLPASFHLDHGVTVYVYRRVRPVAANDFKAFCARLEAAHPDVPVFFQPPVGPGFDLTDWPQSEGR
ncbi:hypothetical protein [Fimbriiglobus ruber]|uniref:Glycosyltransferase RgtA/B/C/D-like domain-containing protein n=1 Tax=Fimbriiglobus ruber TaxID=1908690 RepID=A0A225DNH1_9BACT|nr:hypothetical protein [Fimbriiglobus ruber]OWK37727.1 hypothetical protein FRUB_06847 [Fimbriiglobus ruber]